MIPLIVAACFSTGPEVIVKRPATDGRSTTVITNSGNGFGNRIVVSNGGTGGTTIIRNARNGWGNRIVVDPEDEVIELPAVRPAAKPPVRYLEDGKFWTQKVWSDAQNANLYWSPADRAWYRFNSEDDSYRPVAGRP